MELSSQLALSYYKMIATINKEHKIYLVQHQETGKIYIKKILDVYHPDIYYMLREHPVMGTPRIIECYEIEGKLHLIEEYISGTTLQEKIDAGDVFSRDILNYMIDLCQILLKLHNLRPAVIHRDIKPSNIMITSYNKAVLLDFNAAKEYSVNQREDTMLLGTKGYAAPEQYGFGASSPQTDIYALGVVLKELLFACHNDARNLHRIADRCTQLDPRNRYQSVYELMQDFLNTMNFPDSANPCNSSIKGDPKKNYSEKNLPGFRSHTLWKEFLASFGYFTICYLSLTVELKDTYGGALWLERICVLIIMLLCVFVCCNYRNVQNLIPLCKSRHRSVRYFGISCTCFVILFAIVMTFTIIESIVFRVVG